MCIRDRFYRMAQSIEKPGRVVFIVEVDDINDALTAPFNEGLGVTGIFVERNGRAYDDPTGLLGGLAAFEMPAGLGHAYLFGEFHVVRALGVALSDRGMTQEQQSHKAFWRCLLYTSLDLGRGPSGIRACSLRTRRARRARLRTLLQ